jgi:hypothetical protein
MIIHTHTQKEGFEKTPALRMSTDAQVRREAIVRRGGDCDRS